MAHEKWISEMLAQRIRRNLEHTPSDGSVCFYGNPLGQMAKGAASWIPERLGVNTGSVNTLWNVLNQLRSLPDSDPLDSSTDLNNLAANAPELFHLLCFWEWLLSLDMPSDTGRLAVLQRTKKFRDWLWGGYELAMLRALEFSGTDEGDADLARHLPLEGVQDASEVAPFLFQIDIDIPFTLDQVPEHVVMLVTPILDQKRLGKSERPFMNSFANWQTGKAASTPSGLRLRDWCGRGTKKGARDGRKNSPTAQLIVAAGIEKFLRSSDNYKELMQTAWSNAMPTNTPTAIKDELGGPNEMAKALSPRSWVKNRLVMSNTDNDTFSLIPTANAVCEDGQTQIEFPLAYEDWMSDRLLNAAVVIKTWGDIDGKRQIETTYAAVLSVEDTDDSGDMMAVQVCGLFSRTPLLNRWDQANPAKRSIKGVITLWQVSGRPRVVLGLDVYLGEINYPPTSEH